MALRLEAVLSHPDVQLGRSIAGLGTIDALILPPDTATRTLNVLKKWGLFDPARLARMTPNEIIRLRNCGTRTLREIVEIAIQSASDPSATLSSSDRSGPLQRDDEAAEDEILDRWANRSASTLAAVRPTPGIDDAFATIVRWVAQEYGYIGVADAFASATTEPDAPPEVRAALESLEAYAASALPDHQTANGDLVAQPVAVQLDPLLEAIRALHRSLTQRELIVLIERTLTFDTPPTLEDLGRRFSVTRERVRQIEGDSLRKIVEAARRSSAIAEARMQLARELGTASPVQGPSMLDRWDALTDDPAEALARPLLLYLAGPYRLDGGWYVLPGAEHRLAQTIRSLVEDGALPLATAVGAVIEGGVAEEHAIPWLERLDGIRLRDERVMRWSGSALDRLLPILSQAKEPMSLEEIASSLDDRWNLRYLANALTEDQRYMRVGLDHWALSSWGMSAFSTIENAIADELRDAGRALPLDDIAPALASRFGVREGSVRAAAAGDRFAREAGTVTFATTRRARNLDGFARSCSYSKDLFRLEGGWAMRLVVDREILRGSGRPIATPFPHEAGLLPGTSARWETPHGPLTLNWGRGQPTLGSVRSAAYALSAVEGDLLFAQVLDDGDAAFHLVPNSTIKRYQSDPRDVLRLQVGSFPGDGRTARAAVAHALGYADRPVPSWYALRGHFTARREADLAALARQAEDRERELGLNG